MPLKNLSLTALFVVGSLLLSFLLWKLTGWLVFFLLVPFVFWSTQWKGSRRRR
jgi:hypothetical protein